MEEKTKKVLTLALQAGGNIVLQSLLPLPIALPYAIKFLNELPKIFPFLDKQGEIKKADEEFFINIIKAGRESGVSEIQLDLGKEQMTGLDITLNKIKRTSKFDFDFGIKGETEVKLLIKYK